MNLSQTDKMIAQFEKKIRQLIQKGLTPKQAVHEAYKAYPVMKALRHELDAQLASEMMRGYGDELERSAIDQALKLSWTGDDLTLSDRTTAGSAIIKGFVAHEIEEQVRKNTTYTKLAQALFDGYGKGGLIPEQDIPKFMDKLYRKSVGPNYNRDAFYRDFKAVQKEIAKRKTGGLRASYKALTEAIEARNDQLLNKAIYQAVQERTRYFANRIARTELARAYHDGFIAKHGNDDDVIAYQWKRSSAHPTYDICDLYAEADLYGLGKGIFPKDKVPKLPAHPNCMCHLKPVIRGSIDKEVPVERIEQGGREYINKLTQRQKQTLFGVFGSKLVDAGMPWTAKAKGYNVDSMVSRLKMEYNKIIGLPDALSIPFGQNDIIPPGLDYIPEGTVVRPKKLMAGVGADKVIHTALPRLMETYGVDNQWQKWAGVIESSKYLFDVHWYYHRDVGHVDFKVKYPKSKLK